MANIKGKFQLVSERASSHRRHAQDEVSRDQKRPVQTADTQRTNRIKDQSSHSSIQNENAQAIPQVRPLHFEQLLRKSHPMGRRRVVPKVQVFIQLLHG